MMRRGEHKTLDGLKRIVYLKHGFKRGKSPGLTEAFPDIIGITLPK